MTHKSLRSIPALLFAVGIANGAASQELHVPAEGIAGLGMIGCSEIIQFDEAGTSLQYLAGWVHGWWTGNNLWLAQKGEPLKDIGSNSEGVRSLHGLEKVIVGRCITEPEATLLYLASDIFFDLRDIP